MRPEFDGEIDSVLRGHARRGGAARAAWDALARPSIPNGVQTGSHLDADEIAAFGEDALPAATRARYSAHLADCDDCRRSVTQVAFAAGVADRINERESAAAGGRVGEHGRAAAAAHGTGSPAAAPESPAARIEPPSWRERLSSIFAPRAWRYAMPVVALFAVGAVVFVAMRGTLREGPPGVAGRGGSAEQRRAPAPAAAETPEAHHADANQQAGASADAEAADAATTGDVPASEKGEETVAGGAAAKLSAKSAGGADQSAPSVAVVPPAAQAEVSQLTRAEPPPPPAAGSYVTGAQPTPLPPAPAAAPPREMISRDAVPPAAPLAVEQQSGERARAASRALPRDEPPTTKRSGPQRGTVGRVAESASDASKDDRTVSRPARGPARNEANSRGANNSEANNRNDPDESKARREEDREQQRAKMRRVEGAETRSVGGRQFRRDGNAWIDTAYRSGQATVSVRRNSEQYRALVADEPEIGSISRALGGEVVVVWKGRAYRVKP